MHTHRNPQLGANHVTFLEKLTDLFETLSLSLPRYQQHYESCMRRQFVSMDKARVVKLMIFVYEDVVNFCSEVYKIFRPRAQGIASSLGAVDHMDADRCW